MVYINRSRFLAPGLIALLCACFSPPVAPEPTPIQYPPVVNTLEYAIQADEAQTMANRLDDAVASANDAFGHAASISFNAGYVSNAPVNSQTWPNPDPTDSNYYGDGWPTWYQQFLQQHRDATRAFAVYFVTAPRYSNPLCTGVSILGITSPPPQLTQTGRPVSHRQHSEDRSYSWGYRMRSPHLAVLLTTL